MSIHKVPIQINPFLEKIIKTFREEKSIIQKSQISIRHNFPEPVGPVCMSDRNRLSQVINNLLSNAYKFTSEGYIELGYQLSDEQIIFYVRDTGIGIAADKIQIIFERFRQADDSITKRFGGTGLGLSISKQIVELLGGKMWVESIPAIGSTFYFSLSLSGITIPDHKGDIAPVKDTSRRKVDFKGRKIIICEDDRSNYLFLESLIKKTGLTLVWALDGQQAVDIFRSNRDADLIIMDIRLPVKDGFQATREIRELDDKIPIIALTAFAFTDDRQKSIVAGCTDYIPKPVKPRDLTYLLNKYLKKKSPD
jgi:CheY-like chemotaxis protein